MTILFQDTATGVNGTDIGARGYNPGGGGFTSIQGNEYELTWGGSGAWRARYNTVILDDEFHLWSDMRRASVAAAPSNNGLFFWYEEGVAGEYCDLHWQRASDALVDIKFHRYDGAYQDTAVLEAGFALAAGAQLRLGVRMRNGVATAYRADPLTGLNEVSLGILAISVDWRDGAHRMIGLGNSYSMVSNGIKWDNITVEDFSTNWTPPTPAPGLTAWGDC